MLAHDLIDSLTLDQHKGLAGGQLNRQQLGYHPTELCLFGGRTNLGEIRHRQTVKRGVVTEALITLVHSVGDEALRR